MLLWWLHIGEVPSENIQTFLPAKHRDFPGVHRDSPGFTRRFTRIYRKFYRDIQGSFLRYGFLFLGFTGKSWEVPLSLPGKLETYQDLAMISPENSIFSAKDSPGISPVNYRWIFNSPENLSSYLFSIAHIIEW